jgi:1-aminocyclopropane-1-carboxylate deaminase/D-cysteine desulfhydrase-like pyridoxal-dependent ACC family enzyme
MASSPNALERAHPTLALPRLDLGTFPTPVERLPLTANGATLWCKREDRASAGYGGNKVRKLEYLLAHAARIGRPLLTLGAEGSHHLLATAFFARQVGLTTWGVFSPQPPTPHVAANRACLERLLAGWIEVPSRPLLPWGMLRLRVRLWRQGLPQPQDIPAGGSNPLGCAGWVAGGLEIAEQVASGLLPPPAEVWVPLGSGGNAGGLLLGLRLGGLASRVMAVRVVEWPLASGLAARLLARRTLALLARHGLRAPTGLDLSGLHVVEGFLGPGYGAPTPAAERALHRAHSDCGLVLDSTYTAKTLAACLARGGPAGGDVLLLNTVASAPPPLPCHEAP